MRPSLLSSRQIYPTADSSSLLGCLARPQTQCVENEMSQTLPKLGLEEITSYFENLIKKISFFSYKFMKHIICIQLEAIHGPQIKDHCLSWCVTWAESWKKSRVSPGRQACQVGRAELAKRAAWQRRGNRKTCQMWLDTRHTEGPAEKQGGQGGKKGLHNRSQGI